MESFLFTKMDGPFNHLIASLFNQCFIFYVRDDLVVIHLYTLLPFSISRTHPTPVDMDHYLHQSATYPCHRQNVSHHAIFLHGSIHIFPASFVLSSAERPHS